jgi:CO/xanthine dehydrogenase Mo-binding subunit
MGQGVRTVVTQIAAEELRLNMERISLVCSDTGITPYDPSTGGSRSTTMMGLAVQLAARDLRQQLVEIAAEALGVEPREVRLEDGAAHARAGRSLSYGELVEHYFGGEGGGELVGRGYLRPTLQGGPRRGQGAFWETAWGAAEVEVDEDTGSVTVRRYVSVADTGRTINPRMAEGQDEGAATQGLGHSLFEAMCYEDGQLLNSSASTYRVPLASDVPERFETILLESGGGLGPYGAKGIGEGAINPIAPAIASALFAATGARITDLPLTPERVWRALRERERRTDF